MGQNDRTPLFYKCKFCGEGFVSIYGLPCTKCRVMASSFKSMKWRRMDRVAVAVALFFLACVISLSVFYISRVGGG